MLLSLACSTLVASVLALPAPQDPPAEPPVPTVVQPPVLPEAVASFGAARSGSWLYTFGGHVGRAHQHSKDNVVGHFRRLNLADGRTWESLPDGQALQGTALVAVPDGSLIRIGGLTALNERREPEQLRSTASVQRYDPVARRWSDLTPLPEPRSSHDAFVVDGRLYVIGGWHLDGSDDGRWHDTSWVADLTTGELDWQKIDTPFHRRALAVARFGKLVAAVGGMTDHRPSRAVSFYDPETGVWSDGPELPCLGFGAAALGIGDALYVNGMDGQLYRLDPGSEDWVACGQAAFPRFFHRLALAPDGQHLLALGGASRSGHLRNIEFLPLDPGTGTRIAEWVLPYDGEPRLRQGVLLGQDVLHTFGGSRGTSRERFATDQFSDQIWRIHLGTLEVRPAGQLPEPRQSMAAVTWGDDGQENTLLGGLGPASADVHDASFSTRSHASGLSYLARSRKVRPFPAEMPDARTSFQAVEHDGLLWVFGGTDFTPEPGGRGSSTMPLEVLTCDVSADQPEFVVSDVILPRPRRSFGGALIGSKYYLVGGLGEGFSQVAEVDVFDFETRTWSQAATPPRVWVSPQIGVIAGRMYLACGGTMRGMRFTEDRTLVAFTPGSGWSEVAELPFPVRHVHMRAQRDRLVFLSTNDPRGDRLTLRMFKPDPAVIVKTTAFGE